MRRWPTGLPIGRLSKPLILVSMPVVTWLVLAREGEGLLPALAMAVGVVAFLVDSAAAGIWPRPARQHPSLDAGAGRLRARGRRDHAWWFLCLGVVGIASDVVLVLAADLPWFLAAVVVLVCGVVAWTGAVVLVRGDKYALRADREGLQFRPAYGRSVVIQWTDRSAVVDERSASVAEIPFVKLEGVKNARGEVVDVNLYLELLDVSANELQRGLTTLLSARGDLRDSATRPG